MGLPRIARRTAAGVFLAICIFADAPRDAFCATGEPVGDDIRDRVQAQRLGRLLLEANDSGRIETLRALSRFGPVASAAVPKIIKSLEDEKPIVRAQSADLLRKIGPDAVTALPALIERLDDTELAVPVGSAGVPQLWNGAYPVRLAVVGAIAAIGSGAVRAVPALTEIVLTPGAVGQRECFDALRSISPDSAERLLLQLSDSADYRLRHFAVEGFMDQFGPTAADRVLKLLSDSDPSVRASAVRALDRFPTLREADIRRVVAMLVDRGSYDRYLSADCIGIGSVRDDVTRLLRRLGADAGPALEDAAAGSNVLLRFEALRLLIDLNGPSDANVANLISVLERIESNREQTVEAHWIAGGTFALLARCGRRAAAAMPVVQRFITKPGLELEAAVALLRIDPGNSRAAERISRALPDLEKELADPDTCRAATQILRRIGPSAVPILVRSLDSAVVRLDVLSELASESPDAKAAVLAEARDVGESTNRDYIVAAIEALERLGPDGSELLMSAAVRLQGGEWSDLSDMAARALTGIGPGRIAPCVDILRRADCELEARRSAGRVLGVIAARNQGTHERIRAVVQDVGLPASVRVAACVGIGSDGASPPLFFEVARSLVIERVNQGAVTDGELLEVLEAVEEQQQLSGDSVDEFVDALLPLLDTESAVVRAAALRVLGRRGNDAAIPQLDRLLRNESEVPLVCAALVATGEPAVPVLTAALRSRSWMTRCEAARSFGKLGSGALGALGDLGKSLADPCAVVRVAACEAIGAIGQPSGEIRSALERMAASDPFLTVQERARHALERCGAM